MFTPPYIYLHISSRRRDLCVSVVLKVWSVRPGEGGRAHNIIDYFCVFLLQVINGRVGGGQKLY
jgi:hypothetical protein